MLFREGFGWFVVVRLFVGFDVGISNKIFPYLEVEAKTKGWVAGNEFTGGNVSCRAGLSMRF